MEAGHNHFICLMLYNIEKSGERNKERMERSNEKNTANFDGGHFNTRDASRSLFNGETG